MENDYLIDFLKMNPSWSIRDNKLFRLIETKNWSESMSIANLISFYAEKQNHHPDLLVCYSKLEISLFTHDSNSITEKDILLASTIEASQNN